VRLVGRRDDVPAPVADDERIAFEDADRVRSHRRRLERSLGIRKQRAAARRLLCVRAAHGRRNDERSSGG
jgi:hypothetical protein